MITKEELTTLGIEPEAAEKIFTLATEKYAEIEKGWNAKVKNAYDVHEQKTAEIFGVQKNPNEKSTDFLQRAASTFTSTRENQLNELREEMKKADASGMTEKFQKLQNSYIELENNFKGKAKEVEEINKSWSQKLKEKENLFSINSAIPNVDFSQFSENENIRNLMLAGFEAQKQSVINSILNEYEISEGKATNKNTLVPTELKTLISEKMKAIIPQPEKKIGGGGGAANYGKEGNSLVAKFGFVPTKGMDINEALLKYDEFFKTTAGAKNYDAAVVKTAAKREILTLIS